MEMDDVPLPQPVHESGYDFSKAEVGKSVWVRTSNERAGIISAFNRYQKRTGVRLAMTTKAVGDDDPRGMGFRAFFVRPPHPKLTASALANIPTFAHMTAVRPEMQTQRERAEHSGCFNDADILEAFMSMDPPPTTAAAVSRARKVFFAEMTPYQIAYREKHGIKKTLNGLEAEGAVKWFQKPEKPRPEMTEREIIVPWSKLTYEQKSQLRKEAHIGTEEDYIDGIKSCLWMKTPQEAFEITMGGYSPLSTWMSQTNNGVWEDD